MTSEVGRKQREGILEIPVKKVLRERTALLNAGDKSNSYRPRGRLSGH